MIRLLQSFSNITPDLVARPEPTRPPKSWKMYEGKQGKEKISTDPRVNLFTKVTGMALVMFCFHHESVGCLVGQNGRGLRYLNSSESALSPRFLVTRHI